MDEDREEQEEKAQQEVEKLSEDPPANLEEWPEGRAMYKTLGGPEGDSSYEDGPTANLGPSGVRHHEDGSVSVDGEKVDDPESYKGDPIPGGPTDPNVADNPDDKKLEDDD